MPNSKPISASLLVCQTVLHEKTGGPSAIRIMDVLTIGRLSPIAEFTVLTYLHSNPGDFSSHTLKLQMVGRNDEDWVVVADAPEERFVYGHNIDPSGPGGYALTTQFTLNPQVMGSLGLYFVQALLDGDLLAQTPFMLKWRG